MIVSNFDFDCDTYEGKHFRIRVPNVRTLYLAHTDDLIRRKLMHTVAGTFKFDVSGSLTGYSLVSKLGSKSSFNKNYRDWYADMTAAVPVQFHPLFLYAIDVYGREHSRDTEFGNSRTLMNLCVLEARAWLISMGMFNKDSINAFYAKVHDFGPQ